MKYTRKRISNILQKFNCCLFLYIAIAGCFCVNAKANNSSPSDKKNINSNFSSLTINKNLESSCPLDSEKILQKMGILQKNLANNGSELDWLNSIKTMMNDSAFKDLEKEAYKNTNCGAQSAAFLITIYTITDNKQKIKTVYDRLIKFADSNNLSAINYLCIDNDVPLTTMKKIQYCKIALVDPLYPSYKNWAFTVLQNIYFKNNLIDKLFSLCKISFDSDEKKSCYNLARLMADNSFYEKNYVRAFLIYNQLASFDDKGLSQFQLAEMYLEGVGVKQNFVTALYWFQQALNSLDNIDMRVMAFNDMGVAYEQLLNYQAAFQCYYQASIVGFTQSQLNLAMLYAYGHGTLQDNKQAYAWVSIAIVKGLQDKNKQKEAEQFKNNLALALAAQDHTGDALKEAKDLTQQYYNQYILHKEPKTPSAKNFMQKLQTAIQAFRN